MVAAERAGRSPRETEALTLVHQESCAEPQSLPKAGIVAVLLHCHELHSIIALLGYAGEDMICHSNQKSECCRD